MNALPPLPLLVCLVALVLPINSEEPSPRSKHRPNVVVILTDDQGWGDLSLHGNTNLSTPRIDALARSGARFENFYVCPVCSPTRAEFLTGRYHPRGGVFSTSAGGERLDLDERTIADVFSAQGYTTGAFGKWHNGTQFPYHPLARGFDEYYGFCSGHWGDYFSPPLDHNGRVVRGEGFCVNDFTDKAMAFMEKNHDKPFFAYLPFNTPHSPMQAPDRWWDKFAGKPLEKPHVDPDKENVDHTRAALAMCENIDWNVGRVLDKLDELSLADNTIVVYFCDNGPNGWRWNGGMRGRKGSTDEGGVRSPLFVRWPGVIPAGTVRTIGAAIDLLPTLCDLADIDTPADRKLDGQSLKPFLSDDPPDPPERLIFSHWNKRVSVRTQTHRLDHRGRLYDIGNDRGQTRNVASENPELAEKLRSAVADWEKEVLIGLDRKANPFPIGHRGHPVTQLPVRDALFSGGIKRSNRFPNCSYLTNWTSTEDRIWWEVDVLEAGTYSAILYYTCPVPDVGSTLQLSGGGGERTATLKLSHDPPVRGHENDRVKRQESPVKNFRPWKMGTIELKKGKSRLSLRSTEIKGKTVADVRLLLLEREE